MKYRKFGNLSWQASALGFGMMRLPIIGEDTAAIDEPEATRMLHYAIDHGVNYVDTAWTYHSEQSEPFVGRALKNGYRDKVKLATKLPVWLTKQASDFDRILNEQLRRLQTDHIDFYLLHSLSAESWRKVRDMGVLPWAEKALADGRIRYLGFSFHDDYAAFQEIVDAYDKWTFCQIQYNYMDIENQAGTRGLKYAADKGLAVVVMEPLLGGRLANPPMAIRELWDKSAVKRSPADWALQWVWDQPEVSLLLSGMTTMQHVQENLASAERSALGALTKSEQVLIAQVRDKYKELCPIPCTKCGYCMPCPSGVDIPRVFEVFNEGLMHDDPPGARVRYKLVPKEARANQCIQCQQCEEVCPQDILVSEWMPKVDEVLAQGKPYAECLLKPA